MNANAAPPPGTRPPVDVASFDRSQLSVYLKDVVTLALGYAMLVPTRDNVRITDDANGRVVFDVGVTF